MAYSEEHIALAAEYALGTLDAEERSQVETMMAIDKDYMAIVEAWEYRLGALNQMVGPVEPRPELWDRVKTAVGLSEPQGPIALPEPEPPPATPQISEAPAVVASPVDDSNVVRLSRQARRWRNVAAFASAIAAALVAMLAVQLYRPELLLDRIRPKPKSEVKAEVKAEVAEVKAPPAVPSAQYVAVLQKDGDSPAFILTVDGATRNFTVRRVVPAAEPGTSFELWLISDKLPRPRSLGTINDGEFTARQVLASYAPEIVNSATYAVTIEQENGSPDGNPHSAPVFAGKLIEAVPPR